LSSFQNYTWNKKIRKAEYLSESGIKKFFDRKFSEIEDDEIFNLSDYV